MLASIQVAVFGKCSVKDSRLFWAMVKLSFLLYGTSVPCIVPMTTCIQITEQGLLIKLHLLLVHLTTNQHGPCAVFEQVWGFCWKAISILSRSPQVCWEAWQQASLIVISRRVWLLHLTWPKLNSYLYVKYIHDDECCFLLCQQLMFQIWYEIGRLPETG